MTGLVARILPAGVRGSRRARYLVERNLLVAKTFWPTIASGFFEPVFYLFAVGIGIGRLAGEVTGPGGLPVPYEAFVAPAMLASSAMNGAVFETTHNVFFKLRYGKIYDAILATPMQPADVAVGEITWSLLRGGVYGAAFLLVMAARGLITSPWGLLAFPAALLIGFAFSAVGMAAASFMRSWQDLDVVNLVTLPLFLFSATFYPLDVYPPALRALARLSPLYHGAELARALTLGVIDAGLWVHVGFLVAMGGVGSVVAARRLERLLLR